MGGENRSADRYRAKLRVRVRVRGRDYLGWVMDMSKGGMRVSTDEVAEVLVGDDVEIECTELGLLTGKARWRSPGRFGLRFNTSSNTTAKYERFRRYFAYSPLS
ncbi:MAG: PilZ domain-containing protein [Rhizobiaceae bacterium]